MLELCKLLFYLIDSILLLIDDLLLLLYGALLLLDGDLMLLDSLGVRMNCAGAHTLMRLIG